jgi:hypothetical protein
VRPRTLTITGADGERIRDIEEWFAHSPPARGERQWKDGYSAKELARAWLRPAPPRELLELLASHPDLAGAEVDAAWPEREIPLESPPFRGNTRNADLIAVGTCRSGRMVIAVEAKSNEPLGDLIGPYVLERQQVERSRVPERIDNLTRALFGRPVVGPDGLDPTLATLRYQLLHATAAAILEAQRREAPIAVCVTHTFASSRTDGVPEDMATNAEDQAAFVKAMAGSEPAPPVVGPIVVPGYRSQCFEMPRFDGLYLASLTTRTSSRDPAGAEAPAQENPG